MKQDKEIIKENSAILERAKAKLLKNISKTMGLILMFPILCIMVSQYESSEFTSTFLIITCFIIVISSILRLSTMIRELIKYSRLAEYGNVYSITSFECLPKTIGKYIIHTDYILNTGSKIKLILNSRESISPRKNRMKALINSNDINEYYLFFEKDV